jgi:toxin-antitoxin system PIN domain toxin
VIAVDTNLLVYAHRRDSAWHAPASAAIKQLAEGRAGWAIPWPCVHEFLAVVTHPRIYTPPSSIGKALAQVDLWLASPTLVLLAEGAAHWDGLRALVQNGRIVGPQVHDARVAALCLQHGVREILTADRDFSRFPKLRTRNPLVD